MPGQRFGPRYDGHRLSAAGAVHPHRVLARQRNRDSAVRQDVDVRLVDFLAAPPVDRELGAESAVGIEHLDAPVVHIGYVNRPVLGDVDAYRLIELALALPLDPTVS